MQRKRYEKEYKEIDEYCKEKGILFLEGKGTIGVRKNANRRRDCASWKG